MGDRRRERAELTRALLLRTAERLYAERGLADVSLRQIVEAAGVGNNSALTYHVGDRTDLIRAIADSHAADVGRRLKELAETARGATDPRTHVATLILPYVQHLASLGSPCWGARFSAQITADPVFGDMVDDHPALSAALEEASATVWAYAPDLPNRVRELRTRMVRLTVIHTCADEEAAAARTGQAPDWSTIGAALVDAVTGLVLAPPASS
ncbi:helix-turn-helix domain-containing protein [Actinoplanes sp. NPDC051851]|uniref:TetR/AcrR family transcriptional regulator n=1 Tax=Actinoplanes sp. NPDC051851 TaxID=3154753 RepID=UPI003437EA29